MEVVLFVKIPLPTNHILAYGQMKSTFRCLASTTDLHQAIHIQILLMILIKRMFG
jgi:hypothetical protein